MVSYGYNGLGDRLSQTVDGVSTNYTLDLNAGLTQVLSDGTNTYLYGNGRIAQKGNTTEFFLGDALGSVRQMMDANAEITLAKNYAPYGETMSSAGNGASPFAYTGEQVDSNGLVYLRARYYSPNDGRFISRDTWTGDANQPMSYNLWNYAQSNSISYTDPTGHAICLPPPFVGAEYANENVKLPKSNWLNTYTAAGIAVQCWAIIADSRKGNDSWGPAQITNKQAETPYGQRIPDPADPDDKTRNRGYGLLCYIVRKQIPGEDIYGPCICKPKDELDPRNEYDLAHPLDPKKLSDAIELMKLRIKMVTDACMANGCSSTDIYIAAALAQNGPGFTIFNLDKKNGLTTDANRINRGGVTLDWFYYFDHSHTNKDDTSEQLKRFKLATDGLKTWYIPRDVKFSTIRELSNIGD